MLVSLKFLDVPVHVVVSPRSVLNSWKVNVQSFVTSRAPSVRMISLCSSNPSVKPEDSDKKLNLAASHYISIIVPLCACLVSFFFLLPIIVYL